MSKNLSWKITFRFLLNFRKSRSTFWFSWICLLGILLTVFVFFTAQAVVGGYQNHIRKTLLNFEAPLHVATSSSEKQQQYQQALTSLKNQNANLQFNLSHYQEFFGFLRVTNSNDAVGIKVRSLGNGDLQRFGKNFTVYWQGDYDEEKFLKSSQAILIADKVYQKLPYQEVEDEFLDLVHPFADLGPTGEFEPQSEVFEVAGIIAAGSHEIDEYYVFISENAFAQFHPGALRKHITQVHTQDLSEVQTLQSLWQQQYPDFPKLLSFFDKNQVLMKLMQLEKTVVILVFVLLFLIAIVNLTSLLHIFGMTYLKEIMILKALGASKKWVRRLFLQMGFVLGVLGTIGALGLGSLLVWYFQTFPLELPSTYGFTSLPILFPYKVFWGLLFGVPVFCVVLAWWPARSYVQKSVIDVLRKV